MTRPAATPGVAVLSDPPVLELAELFRAAYGAIEVLHGVDRACPPFRARPARYQRRRQVDGDEGVLGTAAGLRRREQDDESSRRTT